MSTVPVDKEIAKQAALDCIHNILKYRRERFFNLLSKELNKRRWPWQKPLTKKQAIKRLKQHDCIYGLPEIFFVKISCDRKMSEARSLYRLCTISKSSTVWVSDRHARIIYEQWEHWGGEE